MACHAAHTLTGPARTANCRSGQPTVGQLKRTTTATLHVFIALSRKWKDLALPRCFQFSILLGVIRGIGQEVHSVSSHTSCQGQLRAARDNEPTSMKVRNSWRTCLGKGRVSVRPLWLMVMNPSSMSMLGVPYSPMVPSFTRWHSGASSYTPMPHHTISSHSRPGHSFNSAVLGPCKAQYARHAARLLCKQ